jgi:hypothetical protein
MRRTAGHRVGPLYGGSRAAALSERQRPLIVDQPQPPNAMGLNQSISMLTIVRGARGLKSMKSTCVLASAGLPAPAGRHCCCPACAYQAVADALVLIQTGRTLAARRILEALEKDLSEAAVLTRLWADWVASNPAGEPQRL